MINLPKKTNRIRKNQTKRFSIVKLIKSIKLTLEICRGTCVKVAKDFSFKPPNSLRALNILSPIWTGNEHFMGGI